MKKILWADKIVEDFLALALEVLPPGFELDTLTELSGVEAREKIKESDYLLVSGPVKISGELLRHAHQLKFIQKLGVGYDTLDIEAIREAGLPVALTRNVNAPAVAELNMLLILALYKRLVYLNNRVKGGHWDKWLVPVSCYDLASKTLGLVGFGNIGRQVARRALAFDARVFYCRRNRLSREEERALGVEYRDFTQIIKEADIISLHLPLTRDTEGIIGRHEIGLMKPSAIIINTSRGRLIDEEALFTALSEGQIAGAGLDVLRDEPPEKDNPLLTLENVVVTPHVGGISRDTFQKVLQKAFENIQRVSLGEGPHAGDILL